MPNPDTLHLDPPSVTKMLLSLIQLEMTLLRPGSNVPPLNEWNLQTSLYEAPLAVDSLERLHLASAVSEVFHLYETVSDDLLLASGRVQHWVNTVLNSLSQFSAQISFRTSGSMGRARLCTHQWQHLEQEVPAWAAFFPGRKRIVSYVPPHHIYGFLNTVLLPIQMGIPVVDARIESKVQLQPGDLLISFPERLNLLASSGRTLPTAVAAVSSTAPLPPATALALKAKGLDSLLEMYGSSETSGIAYRFDPFEPFTLLSHWAPGPGGDLIRTGPTGQQHAFEIPDSVTWLSPRSFRVDRRKDGSVQVGGINVFPQSVADRIAAHHLMSQAFVRPAQILGQQRLKAFLVFADPRLDTPKHRNEITAWIRGEFRNEERPVVLTFGQAPPRNEMGKLMDWPVETQPENHQ